MRHHLPTTTCALLLLPALPFLAHAQSNVVLYGNIDLAVSATRTGAPGAGTVTGVSSGVNSSSRWGVRGSEDMGSGLKAYFQLESGFDADTGAQKSYSGDPSTATPTALNGTAGVGFNRRSVVGIEGPFGSLSLGRDYTPVYWVGLESDILRYGMYGDLQELVIPAGGAEGFARVSNAVFYATPTIGGFTGRAVYSFGSESSGVAGRPPKSANTFWGLSGTYRLGSLWVGASYQELRIPLVAGTPLAFTGQDVTRKDGMVGAKYSFGNAAVSGGWWKVGNPRNATLGWVGASWTQGPGTLAAQVQQIRQDNPTGAERKGIVYALAYTHAMSKRTSLYASFGRISNNATASFTLLSSDTSVAAGRAGADPTGLAIGIRHTF